MNVVQYAAFLLFSPLNSLGFEVSKVLVLKRVKIGSREVVKQIFSGNTAGMQAVFEF
jgi:hypothetical protein